jgi:uncharacterized membrane protein (DUF485 family)
VATTSQPDAPPALDTGPQFRQIQEGQEFHDLRHSFRSFAFPATVAFVAWYLLYVLLSGYAGGFMATKLVGHINVAMVMGLLQFFTTFGIAWLYARYAASKLDPPAALIRERIAAATTAPTKEEVA